MYNYIRDDDKEIVALRQVEFTEAELAHSANNSLLEKDACLISITL
jgi:hypothetical protein